MWIQCESNVRPRDLQCAPVKPSTSKPRYQWIRCEPNVNLMSPRRLQCAPVKPSTSKPRYQWFQCESNVNPMSIQCGPFPPPPILLISCRLVLSVHSIWCRARGVIVGSYEHLCLDFSALVSSPQAQTHCFWKGLFLEMPISHLVISKVTLGVTFSKMQFHRKSSLYPSN